MYELKPDCDLLYICGDFNARCADMSDFIIGVDSISERHFDDYGLNKHGHLFTEFLHSSEMCMLNGRNYTYNDFTFVSSHAKSVVDYCVMSKDDLPYFKNFEVMSAHELYDKSGCMGVFTPDRSISDHLMIKWDISLDSLCYEDPTEEVAAE